MSLGEAGAGMDCIIGASFGMGGDVAIKENDERRCDPDTVPFTSE